MTRNKYELKIDIVNEQPHNRSITLQSKIQSMSSSLSFDYIVVMMVLSDAFFSLMELVLAVYDPASHPALSPTLLLINNLTTSDTTWTVLRSFFFSISFIIRLLMGLEMVARIYSAEDRKQHFKEFENLIDLFIVLSAIITKPSLPSREGLLLGAFMLLPRLWRLQIIQQAIVQETADHYLNLLSNRDKAYKMKLDDLQREKDELRFLLINAQQKLKLLTGEGKIMLDEHQSTTKTK